MYDVDGGCVYIARYGGREAPRLQGLSAEWIHRCDQGGNARVDYSGHVFEIPGGQTSAANTPADQSAAGRIVGGTHNGGTARPRRPPEPSPPPAPPEGTAFEAPVGLAIHSDELFVLDAAMHRLAVFGRCGVDRRFGPFLRFIGGPGTDPGQFHSPRGVAADGEGCLYVVDETRVQVLSHSGRAMQVVTPPGTFHLGGLCVTEGHVVVADVGGHVLHVLRRCGAAAQLLRRRALALLRHLEERSVGGDVGGVAEARGEEGAHEGCDAEGVLV